MNDENKNFTFSRDNQVKVDQIIAKYPVGRQQSAVMPLLDLAQRQNPSQWISEAVVNCIADILDMPPMRVHEVASFYTMYNKSPVGRFHIQVCQTTPCWLRESDDIIQAIRDHLGISMNETTSDNLFTLSAVECLGACCNAPVVQINDDYYEDLTPKSIVHVLKGLAENGCAKTGSQLDRISSEPSRGVSSLNLLGE